MQYFKQSKGFSCGPACARMMLHELAMEVPEESLIDIMEAASGKGTPMENWRLLESHFAVEVQSREHGDIAELQKLKKEGWQVTVLIMADVPHYVSFLEVRDGRVYMHDPWDTPFYSLLERNFLKKWRICPEKWRPDSIYISDRWFVAIRPRTQQP